MFLFTYKEYKDEKLFLIVFSLGKAVFLKELVDYVKKSIDIDIDIDILRNYFSSSILSISFPVQINKKLWKADFTIIS